MIGTNVRIAIRSLWRNRFFSAINILGFALGLAGFTLILLHVQFELSFDRFHAKADRLYLLTDLVNWGNGWNETWQTAAPMGPALVDEFPEVENSCRLTPWFSQTLQVEDRKFVERIWFGDPAVFEMFSIPLLQGEAGQVLKQANTIVLSRDAAKKYFGTEDPVGQTITWHDKFPLTVVGVFEDLPANSYLQFDYLISTATLRSPDLLGESLDSWKPHNYYSYIQLQRSQDVESVKARFPAYIQKHYGVDGWETYRPQLREMTSLHLRGDYRQIRMLVIIALFILAIAIVNYMNLSTARAARRAREVGVRKVMGGTRFELSRLFLAEAGVVTFGAILLAAFLVEISLPWFQNLAGSPLTWSLLAHPAPIVVLVVVVTISTLLSGGYAALYLTAFQPAEVLKSSRSPSSKGAVARRLLVGFQFALSIGLVLATLTVRDQHRFMMSQELGFDKEHLLYLPMQSQELIGHAEDIRDQIKALPGVASASVVSRVFGQISGGVWGVKSPEVEQEVAMYTVFSDWDFLDAMDVELAEGRSFSREFPTDKDQAFLLNENAMEKLQIEWEGDRRVELPGTREGEVVGVLKDFHFQSMYYRNNPICVTFIRNDYDRRFIAVRTLPGQIEQVVPALEQIWQDFDPALAFEVTFLDQVLEAQYRKEQRLSSILSWFTGFTLLVAMMGLFALSTFLTEQRTKEIGIRKVLGASVASVLSLLARDFARPVLLANLVAWPIAWWFLKQWLEDYVYRIQIPWWSFVTVSLVVLIFAEATVMLQAFRAAQSNPVDALHHE